MSELIDRIPGQESFLGKLHAVVDTTMQMKARQRISGRSGQLGYGIQPSGAWTYETSVAYTTNFDPAEFLITFTGDGTQQFPIVIPELDVRINGTGTGNRLVFNADYNQYVYEDAAVFISATAFGEPVPSSFESENTSVWKLRLFCIGNTGSGTFPLKLACRAQASCNGVFSVVRSV